MNETLLRTLKTACSEAEILDALARLVYKVHGDGEPEIPTVEALAGWLPMAPEKARVEAGELLKQLPWHLFPDEILEKDGDPERARWQTAAADDQRGPGHARSARETELRWSTSAMARRGPAAAAPAGAPGARLVEAAR